MKKSINTLAAIGALVITVSAQTTPKPGSILLSCTSPAEILALDPATGTRTPVLNRTWHSPVDDVLMDRDNKQLLWILGGGTPLRHIKRWTPAIPQTNVTPGVLSSGSHAGAAIDVDGSLLFAVGGSLYRSAGGVMTTIYTSNTRSRGRVAVRGEDGAYLLISPAGGGSLLVIDRNSHAVSTMASNLGALTDVGYDQRTGGVWITTSDRGVKRLGPTGGVAVQFGPIGAQAIKVDQVTGNVYVATRNAVHLVSRTGVNLKAWMNVAGAINGIEVYGSEPINSAFEGQSLARGSTYTMQLGFIESPSAGYQVVASLSGTRNGIPVGGGRRLNVVADHLFFATERDALNYTVTSQFVGLLDSQGRAVAAFKFLRSLPAGFRVSLAAVAINRMKPFNLDVSPALTVIAE